MRPYSMERSGTHTDTFGRMCAHIVTVRVCVSAALYNGIWSHAHIHAIVNA